MGPGDLVRYVDRPRLNPPRLVIPKDQRPVGIVVETVTRIIGDEPGTQSILELVYVRWADDTWNEANGVSEECKADLELVQAGAP